MHTDEEPSYLIIPAAGLGTRMRSVNPDVPKEMLPVGHKPAVQYAVEEGISAGIKNIVIIINKEKEILRRYFEDDRFSKSIFPLAFEETRKISSACSMTFLYQDEPSGESDAIGCAGDIVGSHSAAVIYPDNICFPAPGALMTLKPFFNICKKDVVALSEVTEKTAPVTGNAGRVDISPLTDPLYNIERFIPKGPGAFTLRFRGEMRACGICISGPHLFDYINRSEKTHESGEHTDFPVRSLILKERGMLGCRLSGTVFDIGNPAGYKLCLEELNKS